MALAEFGCPDYYDITQGESSNLLQNYILDLLGNLYYVIYGRPFKLLEHLQTYYPTENLMSVELGFSKGKNWPSFSPIRIKLYHFLFFDL